MKLADFDYDYPEDLVAQHPLPERDASRMMVVPSNGGDPVHCGVRDLPRFLRAGDVLVINITKVLPVRLLGLKESGGGVEVVLLRKSPPPRQRRTDAEGDVQWWCLTTHTKRLKTGIRITFSDSLSATVGERDGDEVLLTFDARGNFEDILHKIGLPPLPPYIVRKDAQDYSSEDRARYQTVFAREAGSAAAPTAGLHLTNAMFMQLRAKEVQIAEVVLHVGRDTFQPVRVENIADHRMHGEECVISDQTAETINLAKSDGRRIIAIGTTSVRALESTWDTDQGKLIPGTRTTRLFIAPGYTFRATDGLLTNFHQPRSTLLMLVSALLGHERTLALYAEAIHKRYRLFSFGDCMLIV